MFKQTMFVGLDSFNVLSYEICLAKIDAMLILKTVTSGSCFA